MTDIARQAHYAARIEVARARGLRQNHQGAWLHYDIRIRCLMYPTGHATEECWLTREQADRFVRDNRDMPVEYITVACTEESCSPVHDVDLEYYAHYRVCLNKADTTMQRYAGRPRCNEHCNHPPKSETGEPR